MEQAVSEVLTGKSDRQEAANALSPLSLTPLARLRLWTPGKPHSQAEVQQLQDAVANRFKGEWEHAVEYVNKRHDRLLNQARGLLTFDGLVLTALVAVHRESHLIPGKLVLTGCVSAVIAASVLLLSQLSVHLGEPSKYADAQKEFPSALIRVCLHGKNLLAAGILSFLALLCLLVSLWIVALKAELEVHPSQVGVDRARVVDTRADRRSDQEDRIEAASSNLPQI